MPRTTQELKNPIAQHHHSHKCQSILCRSAVNIIWLQYVDDSAPHSTWRGIRASKDCTAPVTTQNALLSTSQKL